MFTGFLLNVEAIERLCTPVDFCPMLCKEIAYVIAPGPMWDGMKKYGKLTGKLELLAITLV